MFIHQFKHFLVSDPFKCGAIHPQKTRSTLNNIHINHTENEEETTAEPVTDVTHPPSNDTTSTSGLHERSSVRKLRIVNGTDCLPGDCPWQVEIFSLKLYIGDMKYGSLSMLVFNVFSGSSHQRRQHRLLWRHHLKRVLRSVGRSLHESVALHPGDCRYDI